MSSCAEEAPTLDGTTIVLTSPAVRKENVSSTPAWVNYIVSIVIRTYNAARHHNDVPDEENRLDVAGLIVGSPEVHG